MAGPASAGDARRTRPGDDMVETISRFGRIVDLPIGRRRWFRPVDVALPAGTRAPDGTVIPQADANRLLRGLIRFVADIDAGSSLEMVWERGHDELWVDAGSIAMRCAPGLLTMQLRVGCDELPSPVTASVPFAVGRPEAPRGLLMSTTDRVDAPPTIAEGWSPAITAFCWEAVLELARRVSAQSGNDRAGRPLVPGAIAAGDRTIVVQSMARHDLSGLDRR